MDDPMPQSTPLSQQLGKVSFESNADYEIEHLMREIADLKRRVSILERERDSSSGSWIERLFRR